MIYHELAHVSLSANHRQTWPTMESNPPLIMPDQNMLLAIPMRQKQDAANVWWMSTGISERIQFLLIGFIILVYFNLYIFCSFLLFFMS